MGEQRFRKIFPGLKKQDPGPTIQGLQLAHEVGSLAISDKAKIKFEYGEMDIVVESSAETLLIEVKFLQQRPPSEDNLTKKFAYKAIANKVEHGLEQFLRQNPNQMLRSRSFRDSVLGQLLRGRREVPRLGAVHEVRVVCANSDLETLKIKELCENVIDNFKVAAAYRDPHGANAGDRRFIHYRISILTLKNEPIYQKDFKALGLPYRK